MGYGLLHHVPGTWYCKLRFNLIHEPFFAQTNPTNATPYKTPNDDNEYLYL